MKVLISVALTLLFLMSCGSSKVVKKVATDPDMKEVFQPEWFQRAGHEDKEYMYVFGLGSSRDRNVAYDEAKANAVQEMTQQLEQKVEAMMTNMRRRHGTGENEQILKSTNSIFRSVASKTIRGLEVDKSKTYLSQKTNKFETYVRLKLPKKQVTSQFKQNLRNEEALYSEFKERQMLRELDEQIEKF